MKVKLLIAALVIALLGDAAAITFLCLYVSTVGQVKKLKRKNKQLYATSLAQTAHQGDAASGGMFTQSHFISQADGQPDAFLMSPVSIDSTEKDMTLFVYLHGMGSNALEPYTFPTKTLAIAPAIMADRPHSVLISLNNKKPASWGNDASISDINQNIHQVLQQFPINRIILVGTSMGGCVALTYATIAPPDIKSKIEGVVCVEGAGNLAALYKTSKMPSVPPVIAQVMGGPPDQAPGAYAARGFLPDNIKNLSPSVKVAVVSAKKDSTVPPELQAETISKLQEHNIQCKLIEVNDGHTVPADDVYLEALDFVAPAGE